MKDVVRPALAQSAGGVRGYAAAVGADDSTGGGNGVVGDEGIHKLKNRAVTSEVKANAVNGDDGGRVGNAVGIQHR